MKWIVLACAIMLSAFSVGTPSAAQAAQSLVQPNAGASPVVVLLEFDGSGGGYGPEFVMYDDWTVIYLHDGEHYIVQVESQDVATLETALNIRRLGELRGSYLLSDNLHQPEMTIFLKDGAEYSYLSVYGAILPATERGVPEEIISAVQVMKSFESSEAVLWLPETVEIILTPYEYAPDVSIVWPDCWPDLDDPATRQHGERFSLHAPMSEYEAIRAFLRTRTERGAVLIDGRKWAALVRFPIPREEVWHGRAE